MAFDDMAWGIDEITSMLKTYVAGGNIPVIKRIQRGTVTPKDNTVTVTLPNVVNPDKCVVLLDTNYTAVTNNKSASSSPENFYTSKAQLSDLTSTQLTITAGKYKYFTAGSTSSNTGYSTVAWQVIEFY